MLRLSQIYDFMICVHLDGSLCPWGPHVVIWMFLTLGIRCPGLFETSLPYSWNLHFFKENGVECLVEIGFKNARCEH